MSKEIYISSTPHETRLAIVESEALSEIYYERENEYTLAGSIYNGRVTRVLPGMQSAFVDVGLERDAFLYITDFLDEQGESAEFESGEPRRNGDRSAENGRERPAEGGRDRRRGERDRSERGERGTRNRDQAPQAPQESAPVREAALVESQEAGGRAERAPGADEDEQAGSRSWRGRRGRRRGRGGEGRNGSAGETAPGESEIAAESTEAEPQGEVLERLHGQSQPEAYEPRESREPRGREDRGRDRDRGGRSRDRSGDRGRRHESAEEAGADAGPAAEPFILPGESLSKYRRGDAAGAENADPAASKPKTSTLTARPSTEFSISAEAWDGGAVLPGETLSRRRSSPAAGRSPEGLAAASAPAPLSAPDAAAEGGGEGFSTGRSRRRERDRFRERPQPGGGTQEQEAVPTSFRSGVSARPAMDPMEAVQPGVTSQHEPEGTTFQIEEGFVGAIGASEEAAGWDERPEERPEERAQEQPPAPALDVPFVAETDVPPPAEGPGPALLAAVEEMHETVAAFTAAEAEPVIEEFHEEVIEYEPGEDASVTYRVQAAGPREFRQPGLVEDEMNLAEVRFDEGTTLASAEADHAYTAVQTGGDMLSELPGEVAIPGAEEDPSNPIEHETAVQSVRLSQAEGTPEPGAAQAADFADATDAGLGAPAPFFSPGDGELEEELMDEDEESELLDVTASYGDDIEEETYEAGAEIGALARERVLEQLSQADLTLIVEDEDDFDIDEEEMEEDELDGSEEIAGSDLSEIEEEEAAEAEMAGFEEGDRKPSAAAMGEFPEFTEGDGRGEQQERTETRRDVRRSGGRERGSRDRRGMANSRSNGRPSRHSLQNTDLPAISDLLKPGQEVLVQIAKEPIAKKGARITSHIALPGRFLVFMPTVNHVGVSRKIESDGERRRLKEILLSEKGEASGGFIVRTAASGATEEELRSDLRFLLNLWADIKQRSESSKSPALIYHDLNLVERILRDQVTDNFSAIWVDTETEYERVLRFLQRFQPGLMRRVKLYTKDTPLFEQFGISEEINKALRSKVWLKSGGSIVINQTEALVAIDINTGKFVGKTARLEDTIVKTNLDAIPEIVRQIRLRDLGGIIVIDFIDMDDRKNRQKVLLALEEELKNDRAPSKVLQFNDFGLVAITRKRVKQSLERTLSTTCGICTGTGMVKSPVTVCNEIYIELRKMHRQLDKADVMLRVNPEVVKQLKSNNGKWLQEMEEISGKTILVKSDPSLHPEQFDIH